MNFSKRIFIQNPSMVFFAALITCCMMFFASCTQKSNESTGIEMAELSGKELYKSVFFADGEFAHNIKSFEDNIDAISKLSAEQKASFDKNIDVLLTAIGKDSPEYFDNFKTAVLSKDHRMIERALIDGGAKMYEQLEEVYPNVEEVFKRVEEDYASGVILTDGEVDRDKIEDQMEDYQELLQKNMVTNEEDEINAACSFAIVCVAYFVLAVHNSAAITVAVAGAAVAVIALAVRVRISKRELAGVDQGNEDMLAFEMLVDELATIQ